MSSIVHRLVTTVSTARSSLVAFERPDRLPRAMLAAIPWGTGPAALAAAAAQRYPQRAAIADDDGAVTYAELWRGCTGAGARLAELGARPGVAVGVMCRNHRGFVHALIGAAATGADVVLMNTGFSAPQLADVCRSEGVSILVHDDEFAAAAAVSGVADVLDEAALGRAAASGGRLRASRHQGRLVILSSGTTGRPKGAARRASGGGAAEGTAALLARLPLRALDTQVVAPPLFHAWGLTHLLLGVWRNATTVISRRFDPAATLEAVGDHDARVLVVVPVMLQRILALGADALVAADTSRLEVIAASGSALGGRLATEVLDRFGPVLYNTYGSTEVAVATVAGPHHLRRHPTTVGPPAAGVRVEVLDGDGNPVPVGVPGRIFVGNAARFDGYTTGGGKESQRGLLSSGDVGHFDENGLLYVDGRDDDMIVSGGENVFPAEVEELLAHHPAVDEVAVIGVDDEEFGEALAAFVVVRPGRRLTADDVRSHVRDQLARYKVPRRVEFLDRLPRNATGKVLKRELRTGRSNRVVSR
jgi:fatty-acyl-CoA synthase